MTPLLLKFGAAAMTSPFLWIPLAIIAVAALAYAIYRYWGPISTFVRKLWQDIKDIVGGWASWAYTAGAKLIEGLWNGIKSLAYKPIEAIKDLGRKMLSYLPRFSPAEVGPLSQLHRIKIVETIAETIRPAPVVSAMRNVAAAAMVAMTPVIAGPAIVSAATAGSPAVSPLTAIAVPPLPVAPAAPPEIQIAKPLTGFALPGSPFAAPALPVIMSGALPPATLAPRAGAAPIQVTYAPTINLAGREGASVRDEVRRALDEDRYHLVETMTRELRRRSRGEY